MSLAACVRRRIPSVHCLARRNASTQAQTTPSTSEPASTPSTSSKVLSHTTLPAAKMRALVALYHQADTWVTPENLLQKIDEAFVPGTANSEFLEENRHIVSYEEIEKARKAMQTSPKMAVWEKGSNAFVDRSRKAKSWSDNREKREMKVIEALYGVVTTADASVLPGLEVVEETAALGESERPPSHSSERMFGFSPFLFAQY